LARRLPAPPTADPAPGREARGIPAADRRGVPDERAHGPIPAQRKRRISPGRKGKSGKAKADGPIWVMTWRITSGTLLLRTAGDTPPRCLTHETRNQECLPPHEPGPGPPECLTPDTTGVAAPRSCVTQSSRRSTCGHGRRSPKSTGSCASSTPCVRSPGCPRRSLHA